MIGVDDLVRSAQDRREQQFRDVWLRTDLSEAEWAEVRAMPMPILTALYKNTWEIGPHSQLWFFRSEMFSRVVGRAANGELNEGTQVNLNRKLAATFGFTNRRKFFWDEFNKQYFRLGLQQPSVTTALAQHAYWRRAENLYLAKPGVERPKNVGRGMGQHKATELVARLHRVTVGAEIATDLVDRSQQAAGIIAQHDRFWVYIAKLAA